MLLQDKPQSGGRRKAVIILSPTPASLTSFSASLYQVLRMISSLSRWNFSLVLIEMNTSFSLLYLSSKFCLVNEMCRRLLESKGESRLLLSPLSSGRILCNVTNTTVKINTAAAKVAKVIKELLFAWVIFGVIITAPFYERIIFHPLKGGRWNTTEERCWTDQVVAGRRWRWLRRSKRSATLYDIVDQGLRLWKFRHLRCCRARVSLY